MLPRLWRGPLSRRGYISGRRRSSPSPPIKIRSPYDEPRRAVGSHGRQFERRDRTDNAIDFGILLVLIIRQPARRETRNLDVAGCRDIGVSIAAVYQIYSGGIGSENNSFNAKVRPPSKMRILRSISDDASRRDVLFTARVGE